ncbi:hypothetical protein JAAARDRAFT_194121 [Jaapia argillacea MUCL 33604]|uniref:Uncharacterized protein n=1 Tax=Jaapia argillacea MUCL 33604 TaxID=933084 RepID=A0A067Q2Y5_9AGAM|nr:hypothetical protein JAAARDRAFT_194121 [Jaapia argillacea MUCL 33604]
MDRYQEPWHYSFNVRALKAHLDTGGSFLQSLTKLSANEVTNWTIMIPVLKHLPQLIALTVLEYLDGPIDLISWFLDGRSLNMMQLQGFIQLLSSLGALLPLSDPSFINIIPHGLKSIRFWIDQPGTLPYIIIKVMEQCVELEEISVDITNGTYTNFTSDIIEDWVVAMLLPFNMELKTYTRCRSQDSS